jgi:archaellum component FlaC
VARIKGLLTESSYENSVLEEVKEEVLNLREILTQIVKQIYTIEETKDFLVKELARNGFLEPLLQHLGNLQSQVESKIKFLEVYLSYLYENYSPGQDTNLDKWASQKPQEMVNLEIEIAELRSINEKINEKIIEFRKSTEQQNQNTNEPKTQEIEDLTKKLEKLKKNRTGNAKHHLASS